MGNLQETHCIPESVLTSKQEMEKYRINSLRQEMCCSCSENNIVLFLFILVSSVSIFAKLHLFISRIVVSTFLMS